MDKDNKGSRRIDRVLVGDPITADGHVVYPVARAGGWYGGANGEQGRGFGALLRIRPVEVRVTDPDGAERTVTITDPTAEAVRGIALAGLFVAGVSALVILLGFLRRKS